MTHQDQTTQETMITLLRACGFDMHNIKHGQHQVKGTIENATAFFKLVTAGADADASASPDAEAELLDMLGRIHPMAMKREDDIGGGKERLTRAFTRQQPWPVPDQACIVWRADLMRMSYDLTHKQAFFDNTSKADDGRDVGTWEEGVLMAVAILVACHDQPTIAATILNELGLRNADCSGLDDFDKTALRKLKSEKSIELRGLEAAVAAQAEEGSTP